MISDGDAPTDSTNNGLGDQGANLSGGSLTKVGAGVLELSNTNTYTGGTTIDSGTLDLDAIGAAGGTSDVTFGPASGLPTLGLETAAFSSGMFANQIDGFALGDVIDLHSIGTATGASFNSTNDQLVISGGSGGPLTLQFAAANYGGFTITPDTNGGSDVTLAPDIVSFTPDSFSPNYTTSTSVVLNGTALPGATVNVFDGNVQINTNPITADSNGDWSLDTSTSSEPTLNDGTHVFSATETLSGLTSLNSLPFDVHVDTTAPTLAVTGTASDAVQGGPSVLLASGVNIADPNGNGDLASATITDANAKAGDVLGIEGFAAFGATPTTITYQGASYSVSFNNGVLNITTPNGQTDTIADYEAILGQVTFSDSGTDSSTGAHPTRTFDWTVANPALNSNTPTTSLTIDRAPSVTAGATASYAAGGAPVVLDSGASVSDADGDNLTGATVAISSGFLMGDRLNFANQNGISGSYDSNDGVLTLTGAASQAAYQSALDSVSYSFTPSNGDPTEGGVDTSRTIHWTVTDGIASSTPAMSTVQTSVAPTPVQSPPAGTTADMILDRASTGDYEIYDIGQNKTLAAYPLANIPSPSHAVALGNFNGTDTTDMAVRNCTAFQFYDIADNKVTQTGVMGAVGTEWSVVGTGNFDSSNYTDMMMEKTGGASDTYDSFIIRNNQIVGANQIAVVGNDWQLVGFGDVNGDGTTDMVTRNTKNGALEYYDIVNGQLSSDGVLGAVGTEWQPVGFGNFDNSGSSDLIMRDSNNGALDLFVIRNNRITSAHQIGAVGSEWQLAGFADINGDGTSDMVLRDTNNGAFEYYDIANGQVTADGVLGDVGTEWSTVGLAKDPPTSNAPAMGSNDLLTSSASPSDSSGTAGWLSQTMPTPTSGIDGWLRQAMNAPQSGAGDQASLAGAVLGGAAAPMAGTLSGSGPGFGSSTDPAGTMGSPVLASLNPLLAHTA